ncbi:MAG: FliH/SctL family protein [Negativicutes bacterium]|nr:FliH/SctL family protein [Negativicutes bacterium]
MYKIFKSVSLRETPVIIAAPIRPAPIEAELPSLDDAAFDESSLELAETIRTETLESARQQADDIVATANFQAEAIAAAATEQAERLKREAVEEGHRLGYNDGLAQANKVIEEATDRAKAIIDEAAEQSARMFRSSEQQMVEIALAVARKILNRELADYQMTVLPLVKAALDKVRDQDRITIRVSPQDVETVQMVKSDLQSSLTRDGTITIATDDGLKSGDCVVETPYGAVDARIDSQLEIVETALRDASNE